MSHQSVHNGWRPIAVQLPEIGKMVRVRLDNNIEGIGVIVKGPNGNKWLVKYSLQDRTWIDDSREPLKLKDWKLLQHESV